MRLLRFTSAVSLTLVRGEKEEAQTKELMDDQEKAGRITVTTRALGIDWRENQMVEGINEIPETTR